MKCNGLAGFRKTFSKWLITEQKYKVLFQKFGKKPTFFNR